MVPDLNSKQAQRLWPRWFIAGNKPVKVDLGPAGSGPLVDISGGGFRVQSLAPLRRGAEVPVRIEIPDQSQPLQCTGIVVWSKPNGAAGVRFTSLQDDQKQSLHAWLADLERAATHPSATAQDEFTSVVSQIRGAQLNNADALGLIVRRAKELSGVSGVAIALGTPESMSCMASAGEAPPVGTSLPAVIGLAGECVFKRKMIQCEDSKNDPRVPRDSVFGSTVILPLIVNGEVRGLIQAFSKRSHAFTASITDSLEKLADAVIFSMYGIVTQRRLATAKGSLNPALAPLGPKASQNLSPLTASHTPPVPTNSAVQATAAAVPAASTASVPTYKQDLPSQPAATIAAAEKTTSAIAARPIAVASIAEPVAAPAPPKPRQVESKPRPQATAKQRPAARQQVATPPKESSSGKWIAAAAVLAIVGTASGWYYANHHQRASNATTNVAVTQPVETSPSPVQENIVRISPKPEVTPSKPVAYVAAAVPIVPSADLAKTAEKERVVQPATPPPAPIVLAENTPRSPDPVDLDSVVPLNLPTTLQATAKPSQIALPVEAKAIPKLAPPPVVVHTGAVLIHQVNPVYPQLARSAHLQGIVELQVHIGKDGSVAKVTRLSGQPMLAGAAIAAVKQWRYTPAKTNGQPTETDTNVKLSFDLYH